MPAVFLTVREEERVALYDRLLGQEGPQTPAIYYPHGTPYVAAGVPRADVRRAARRRTMR
jgi:hypothetical protein